MWIHHRDRSFNDLYDFYFWNIFHSKTRARKAIDRSQLSFSTTAQFAAATAPTRSCSTLVCQWRKLGAAVTAFPPQSAAVLPGPTMEVVGTAMEVFVRLGCSMHRGLWFHLALLWRGCHDSFTWPNPTRPKSKNEICKLFSFRPMQTEAAL